MNSRHSVTGIVTIGVCSVINAAESFPDMQDVYIVKWKLLAQSIELGNGIPSQDTLDRAVAILDKRA